MLKRLLTLIVIGFIGYIAWPVWTAYDIYRATRDGDHKTLESKVDWQSLRTSVKSSLRQRVADETMQRLGRSRLVERISLGLQKVTDWRMVEKRVADFATPGGLIAFDAGRREQARQLGIDPPQDLVSLYQRLNERVKRIAFVSPTRVEFEMADRFDSMKRIASVLELRSDGWKLTELHMFRVDR